MVSNRTKRNISATLMAVGILCIVGRIWDVVMAPKSGMAWFGLFGIILLTYLCYDNFKIYNRRLKNGTKHGS